MSKTLNEIRAKLRRLNPHTENTWDNLKVEEQDLTAKSLTGERLFEVADPQDYFGNTLKCPKCQGDYLHHRGVEIFACKEDATTGQHRVLVSEEVDGAVWHQTSDTSMEGNPSSRRGGILIHFMCEYCGELPTYYIAQHKGQTQVGWCG